VQNANLGAKMNKASFKQSVKYSPLIFSIALCYSISAPKIANSQQAPVSDSACSHILPDCPAPRTIDQTQVQAANVNAAITINGQSIDINIPGYDTQNPPATISASAINSSSVATSNSISASSADNNNLSYNSNQLSTGNITSNNIVTTIAPVTGTINMVSMANGNSAQGETCCSSMDFIVNQNQNTGAINAISNATTAPDLGSLVMNSQSASNIFVANGDMASGLATFVINQDNASLSNASTYSTGCCNNEIVSQNAVAMGNNSATRTYSATSQSWLSQNNSGEVNSSSETITNDGAGLSTVAQSIGNAALQYNNSGYTQGFVYQNSTGEVSSYANSRPVWYNDTAAVWALSQGNSATMSTIGSEGMIISEQNTGAAATVSANAEFFATTSGGVGSIMSAASGNGLVGFACSACGNPGIQISGDSLQTNNANINSTITMNNNNSGTTTSYGIAAGNSATFSARNGSNVK
jgi:trimeric autotransporter adhesin